MRIGIDFDNTIACYEGVFHRAALERGLIPADLPPSKNSVRDHLNGSGRKDEFTELQGYVYGSRMDLVAPYQGAREFMSAARRSGHELFVVSHKTRHPMLGPKHDMHEAARGFLRDQGFVAPDLLDGAAVFFAETKDAKADRAAALGCDAFVDDLPDVLAMITARRPLRAILFDPHGDHPDNAGFERAESWAGVEAALLGPR